MQCLGVDALIGFRCRNMLFGISIGIQTKRWQYIFFSFFINSDTIEYSDTIKYSDTIVLNIQDPRPEKKTRLL